MGIHGVVMCESRGAGREGGTGDKGRQVRQDRRCLQVGHVPELQLGCAGVLKCAADAG